jgi:YD repeat-containing protein
MGYCNSSRTAYTYDYQNRLVKKQYPSGTLANYTYDSAGRLTQVTDGTGTYSFMRN